MRQRLVIIMVLIAMVSAAPAWAEVRLAYVDIQRALNECNAGKRAKLQIREKVDEITGRLKRQQAEIQSLQDELQKKGALMRPDQRQNLSDEYASKMRDFQQNYKNAQDELRQKDQEVTAMIVRDLATVVRNISEKDGYTMVMEKGEILWGTPSIDITDEVIRSYDAMHVEMGSLGEQPDGAGGGHAARAGSGNNEIDLGGGPPSTAFGSSSSSQKRSTISR
ncbi:MAG TPA: OmpH family outer membrane protein [Candidatus Binataceae bacterium]|nr:OmpH family outer membrane protein [Candidatus Binataceae bacterium]